MIPDSIVIECFGTKPSREKQQEQYKQLVVETCSKLLHFLLKYGRVWVNTRITSRGNSNSEINSTTTSNNNETSGNSNNNGNNFDNVGKQIIAMSLWQNAFSTNKLTLKKLFKVNGMAQLVTKIGLFQMSAFSSFLTDAQTVKDKIMKKLGTNYWTLLGVLVHKECQNKNYGTSVLLPVSKNGSKSFVVVAN